MWPQSTGDSISDRVDAATRRRRTQLREAKWSLKERINRAGSRIDVVSGDIEQVLTSDRVVVLAEWSKGGDVRPDALAAAQAYAAAGWATLVVAARDPWVRLRRQDVADGVVVARRNSAYDFGSWRDALAKWPGLAATPHVILTNDSLVGPVGPVDDLLEQIESSTAQVWAATMNHRPTPHLQSNLLGFSGGVLATPPFREFFQSVVPQSSKRDVVLTYEFGISRLVEELGLQIEVGWSQHDIRLPDGADAVLAGWEALLDSGFPFVKRTLLTDRRFEVLRPAIREKLQHVAR